MKAAIIIPARYGSTRFPGKVLQPLLSRPLIEWIYEFASRCRLASKVIVATDDERIYAHMKAYGGEVVMTSSHLRTGSDRCAEVAKDLEYEIIINLQGDEIPVEYEILDELIALMSKDKSINMGTLKREILSPEELWDRNVVKVVTDRYGNALYFSRHPIPCLRDMSQKGDIPAHTYYKHIGMYGFRKDFLLHFASLPSSHLEELEKLEQLRVLEWGFPVRVKETFYKSYRVDTPEDLRNIEKIIGEKDHEAQH